MANTPEGLRNAAIEKAIDIEPRIQVVTSLITRGGWNAAMAFELGKQWGVGAEMVARYSGEAYRRVRLATQETDWRLHIQTAMARIAEDAEADGDRHAAIKALDLIGRIHGIYAPEVHVNLDLEALSDDEFEQRRREVLAGLEEAANKQPVITVQAVPTLPAAKQPGKKQAKKGRKSAVV